MEKPLEEMPLEELWELFPIFLVPHREIWKDWYAQETASLAAILPGGVRLHHIGSTAVADIMAKPVVDILAEVPPGLQPADLKPYLEQAGYICMNASPHRVSFNKGYTPDGYAERVFHLHAVPAGETDEIIFRDYLREHPQTAQEYEKLKLQLAKEYSNDRDAYTEGKTAFVREVTDKGRRRAV